MKYISSINEQINEAIGCPFYWIINYSYGSHIICAPNGLSVGINFKKVPSNQLQKFYGQVLVIEKNHWRGYLLK